MKRRDTWSLSAEQLAYLEEHYHNTSNEDLAKALGISVHTINSRRTRHGWKKSEEYLHKVRHDVAVRNDAAARLNVKETHAKGIATRTRLYEAEKARIRWGLPQLTKRRFRSEPREKQMQRTYLRGLGYVIDDARLVAYYTPETHRARRLESVGRGERRGKIKPFYEFKPLEYEKECK